MRRAFAWTLAILAMLAVSAAAAAERRVALVIGNSKYESLSALVNPSTDAAAIAGALRGHGFEVFDYYDLGRADFLDALETFKREADTADVALVYYAGHGMEIDGKNVLAPVDMEINCEPREARRAVDVGSLFSALGNAPQQVVLLDACRNDPFPQCPTRSTQSGSGFRGFQLVREEDRSLVIANATLSGQLAADGEQGGHSPFAKALLARFDSDADSYLRDLLDQAARDVRLSTRGAQIPEITTQGGAPRFCLDPDNCGAAGIGGLDDAETPEAAAEVATLLGRLGYVTQGRGGAEDAALAEAIRRFQASAGLPADGRVTATLVAVLRATASQMAALPSGQQGGAEIAVPPRQSEHAPGESFRDCENCPEMVALPGGAFRMGAGPDDPAASQAEGPLHEVAIVTPLAVSKYEITFDDWEACNLEGGCGNYRPDDSGWGQGRHPVTNVSWDDAKAYVDWLRRKTGKPYRLLSEAEWEYAARGGTTSPYITGDTITTAQANFDASNVAALRGRGTYEGRTVEVGSFPPNPFGLYDMAGNVAEWVEDCWNPSHAGAPADGTVRGGDCARRVLKGGAWYYEPEYLRSAARTSYPRASRLNIAGIRIARPLE